MISLLATSSNTRLHIKSTKCHSTLYKIEQPIPYEGLYPPHPCFICIYILIVASKQSSKYVLVLFYDSSKTNQPIASGDCAK